MTATKSVGETAAARSAPVQTAKRRDRRWGWLAAATAVLLFSTLVAFLQPPRPDPHQPPRTFSLAWFLNPLERHAEQRLPVVGGELHALWVSSDGDRVWTVGDGGLILGSEDGGDTWRRLEIGERAGGGGQDRGPGNGASTRGRVGAKSAAAQDDLAAAGASRLDPGWHLPGGTAWADTEETQGEQAPPLEPSKTEETEGTLLEQAPPPEQSGVQAPPTEQRRLIKQETLPLEAKRDLPPDEPTESTDPGPDVTSSPPLDGGTGSPPHPQLAWVSSRPFRTPGASPTVPLLKIVFLDDGRHGWIGGAQGLLLRTRDGGMTWEERSPPDSVTAEVIDLAFSSARDGCAILSADEHYLVFTRDGGETWGSLDPVALNDRGTLAAGSFDQTEGRPSDPTDICWLYVGDFRENNEGDEPRAAILQVKANGSDSAERSIERTSLPANLMLDLRSAGGALWALDFMGVVHWKAATSDAWEARSNAPFARVNSRESVLGSLSLEPVSSHAAWIVRSDLLWRTLDGGATWQEVRPPEGTAASTLVASHPLVSEWLLGAEGALAVTRDNGENWRRVTRRADLGHHALYFFDKDNGFAGGLDIQAGGYLARTDDGGRTWEPVLEGLEYGIKDLGFAMAATGKPTLGWAVARSQLLVTEDGGRTWRARGELTNGRGPLLPSLLGPNSAFRSGEVDRYNVPVEAPLIELALDEEGSLKHALTAWGGALLATVEWAVDPDFPEVAYPEPLEKEAASARGDGDGVGWVAIGWMRSQGTFRKRGDELWVGLPTGLARGPQIPSGAVPDPDPILFEPVDGPIGRTPVAAFHFADLQHGWVAEPGGGLLATTDGGNTWSDLTPHRIWPPPWYWLALIVGLALLAPAMAPPPPERIERSVAELAVTDRPIGPGDPDPLGFQDVALGLSRFLRNTATKPPITLAVTGEWGTGKSSLMNLLCADLASYGFRPVWFNAWHHQKEEQLLAALLENIRRQAVPSWLRVEGWSFRARLLGRRLQRWFVPALLVVVAFGLVTGWVVARGEEGWRSLGEVAAIFELLDPTHWIDVFSGSPSATEVQNAATPRPAIGAWLLTLIAVGYTLYRGLRAFGIKPAALVAGLSERARVRDVEAQTGFRYRFSREFQDVTQALAPRTLTVLIDDLDRCRPQNVLDVLEAVNFLVSSGDCFVVLGIDRERVERCVGYGFRDVAEEILDRDLPRGEQDVETGADTARADEPAERDEGRQRRALFARQYLEKLINIEVPVPLASEPAGRELISPSGSNEVTVRRRWRRISTSLLALCKRWWFPPALLSLGLVSGLWLGAWQGGNNYSTDRPPMREEVREPTADQSVAATAPGDEALIEGSAAESDGAAGRTGRTDGPAGFTAGQHGERPWWLWAVASLLVVGAAVWVLGTLPEVQVHDSQEFLAAIDRWYPLLYATSPTPRRIKRFLNRVRFYAMRQRTAEPRRSRLTALGERVSSLLHRRLSGNSGRQPNQQSDRMETASNRIPEDLLVALATLEQTHPEWLEDDLLWEDPHRFFSQAGRRVVPLALIRPLAGHRQAFERLSRGIETQ